MKLSYKELEQIMEQVKTTREMHYNLFADGIELPPLDNTVIDLLEAVTGDTGWISIWANELDFGDAGSVVTTANGDIRLNGLEDVWALLNNA